MIKFSHSIFALPFAFMATFIAGRDAFRAGLVIHIYPGTIDLLLIVGCMVAARSTAMTFNRIVDAKLDFRNPRTSNRAIPAGIISYTQAITFLAFAVAAFMLCCGGFWWWRSNPWPLLLALPVLAYLCFYSYTKRFTKWSHFALGTAIALSPVAAWLAIYPPTLGWPAITLMAAVALWIGGFDIIYACQDVESDRKEGLYSLPARLGIRRALTIARSAHAATVLLLVLFAHLSGLGVLYMAGIAIVAILLLVENALVRANNLSRINFAFFNINGAVSVILGILTVADVLLELDPVW